MKLKDFIANRQFDVNTEYDIYYGTWDDGGELLWSSICNGRICEDDFVSQYEITYVTIDVNTKRLIIEVG